MALLLVFTAACGRFSFDEASRVDASLQADAPMKIAPACGATVVLADDFTDAMPGPAFQCDTDPGVMCSESGGNLDIVFTPPIGMYRFAFYTSVGNYALQGLCLTTEITVLPGDDAAVFYKLRGFREAEFIVARTFLAMRTQTSEMVDTNSYTEVAPDPAWRYFRLRSQNGNAYWDVSSDAVTFYELRESVGIFASSGSAAFVLGAGAIRDTTMPTFARFASVEATQP